MGAVMGQNWPTHPAAIMGSHGLVSQDFHEDLVDWHHSYQFQHFLTEKQARMFRMVATQILYFVDDSFGNLGKKWSRTFRLVSPPEVSEMISP
jgi:hypothetical protein